MIPTVETFGKTLNALIARTNVSHESICRRMGIKSQTTLNRILLDKSSPKRARAFFEELQRYNPLQFSKEDFSRLQSALQVNLVGYEDYVINQGMLTFLKNLSPATPCLCQKVYGDSAAFEDLSALFEDYKSYAKLNLLVHNCLFSSVTSALSALLNAGKPEQIQVFHAIGEDRSPAKAIQDFFNLLSVLNFPQYNCYRSSLVYTGEPQAKGSLHNSIYVIKETHQGQTLADVISISDPNQFTLLTNVSDSNVCAFYESFFQATIQTAKPLKDSTQKILGIMGYLESTKLQTRWEERFAELELRATVPLKAIPASLLARPVAKFFHDPGSVKLERFLRSHESRHQNFLHRKKNYTCLFSQKGIDALVQTGQLGTLGDQLDPMPPEDIKLLLQCLIDATVNNPNLHPHLLKCDMNYPDYAYQLFEGSHVVLTDNRQSLLPSYYVCTLKNEHIMRGLSNFIHQELLSNYSYTEAETLDFFRTKLDELS